MIFKKAYARVGLMGNPSDGFYGKTLSCCIVNFHAEVILTGTQRLRVLPHETHDATEFSSLKELSSISTSYGYYGGLRLIQATCKYFYDYCQKHQIPIDAQNFTVRYDTNIPRQVGLGGSSAIITALLKALMEFYGVTEEQIPLEIQPNLVLGVETKELGITAGLQDRVIQAYGGLVYMDFCRATVETTGSGTYTRLDPDILPDFFLAYITDLGKESGKVHNEMRFRFEQHEPQVVEAMCDFAGFAADARIALEVGDVARFKQLMSLNFNLRHQLYGDAAVGRSLDMVKLAQSLNAPAKFPGSGGAIVGVYDSSTHFTQLREAFEAAGYKFVDMVVDRGNGILS